MKAARFNPLAFHPEGPGLRRSPQRPPPGGRGVGQLGLKIMVMNFPGAAEHGQIRIGA